MNPVWPKEPDRKQLAAIAGEGRFDIPSEPAKRGAGRRLAGRGHLFQSELPQRETAGPAGQAVEQILRIDRDFAGGAEEPGVAGNSAHAPGSWIVDHSAEHDALIVLGGCDAAAPGFRRKKSRVLHAQWLSEMLLLILIEGEAGEFLDQRAEHDEVDVAVAELHARRGHRRRGKGTAQALFFAFPRIVQ